MSTAASDVARAFQEKAYSKPTFMGRFFMHPTLDQEKSKRYGINVYNSHLFIEIKTKGRKNTTTRRATEEDRAMFYEALERFNQSQNDTGIPLRALAGWSTDNERSLNDLGIKSVESLVDYSGELPWYELRIMKDSAIYLNECLLKYSPIQRMENEDVRPKEVPVHRKVDSPRYQTEVRNSTRQRAPVSGEASQRVGVYLDENGNTERTEGHTYEEEGFQKEGREEKSREKEKLTLVF